VSNQSNALTAQAHERWEVSSFLSVGVHVKLGLQVQLFEFRPVGGQQTYKFGFVGAGLGKGFSAGGSTSFVPPHRFAWDTGKLVWGSFREVARQLRGLERERVEPPDWSDHIRSFKELECDNPFSACELNRSMGVLKNASASLAMGYGALMISAYRPGKRLFTSQSIVGGQGGGVALSASANKGIWLRFAS